LTQYAVRWLKRWPHGTKFTEIAAELAPMLSTPPFAFPKLAIDMTSVGHAVAGVFRQAQLAASIFPVVVTSGRTTGFGEGGSWHVPKQELVSVLQVLLQSRRLAIAKALPEAATLTKELEIFRSKVTTSPKPCGRARLVRAWEAAHLDASLRDPVGVIQIHLLRYQDRYNE
jgi:hypothetical protein